MSKIKDQQLKENELQMTYYGKFMDHIYDVLHPEPRVSGSDIEDMEKSYGNSSKPVKYKCTKEWSKYN